MCCDIIATKITPFFSSFNAILSLVLYVAISLQQLRSVQVRLRPPLLCVSLFCRNNSLLLFRSVGGHLCPPFPSLAHSPHSAHYSHKSHRVRSVSPAALPSSGGRAFMSAITLPSSSLLRSLFDPSSNPLQPPQNQHNPQCRSIMLKINHLAYFPHFPH